MVAADGAAPRTIDLERERGAHVERALFHRAGMDEHVARLALGVGYREPHPVGMHHAGVANLAARFAVERRLVEDDGAALASAQSVDLLAVLDERRDDPLGGLGFIAQEVSRTDALLDGKPQRLGRGLA